MQRVAIAKRVRLPPRATVQVIIGSQRWRRVGDVRAYGPQDRVYALRHTPDGRVQIFFGDGRRGKVPPKGSSIRITYRRADGTSVSLRSMTHRSSRRLQFSLAEQ